MRAMSILVGSMRKCGSCACRASHSVRYSRLSGLPGWPGTSSLALATTTRGCTSVRPALRPVARTRRASFSPTSRSCTRMASTSSRATRRLAVKCDARYGENPNRLQRYYQYQVVLKPNPDDILELYFGSLKALGIDPLVHDLRLVEDNWESPTLGAWGLGWEVWLNGMEVTQFTYFQAAGGLDCRPVTGEITYGLERLAMYLQNLDSVFDLVWTKGPQGTVRYGDVYHQNEVEQSHYNFEHADVAALARWFEVCEAEAQKLVGHGLALPAYEQVCKASHAFNLLDARRAIGVTERQRYILRVRALAKAVAETYYAGRERLGFPG